MLDNGPRAHTLRLFILTCYISDILKGLKRVSAAFGDLDLSLDMEESTGASSDGHESMSSTEDPEEDIVIDFIE